MEINSFVPVNWENMPESFLAEIKINELNNEFNNELNMNQIKANSAQLVFNKTIVLKNNSQLPVCFSATDYRVKNFVATGHIASFEFRNNCFKGIDCLATGIQVKAIDV
jgi:hypothetical protein